MSSSKVLYQGLYNINSTGKTLSKKDDDYLYHITLAIKECFDEPYFLILVTISRRDEVMKATNGSGVFSNLKDAREFARSKNRYFLDCYGLTLAKDVGGDSFALLNMLRLNDLRIYLFQYLERNKIKSFSLDYYVPEDIPISYASQYRLMQAIKASIDDLSKFLKDEELSTNKTSKLDVNVKDNTDKIEKVTNLLEEVINTLIDK